MGRDLGGLIAMALAGCSLYFGGDAPDAGPVPDAGPSDAIDYTALLDIDVVVRTRETGDGITVYLAEVDRPCECAGGGLPNAPGRCTFQSDAGGCQCAPAPAACLHQLTIERAGEVAELVSDEWYDPTIRRAAIPGTGPEAVLHLRGCGAETDLRIAVGPPPATPVLGDLVGNQEQLLISWTNGEPPLPAVVWCGDGLHAVSCHEIDGRHETARGCWYMGAYSLAGAPPVATDHGEIRTWQAGDAYYAELHYPQGWEGRWSIGADYRNVSIQTADGAATVQVYNATIDLAAQPLDTSLQFWAGGIRYTAGPLEDTIEWAKESRTCSATVPHRVPSAPLLLGNPYPEPFSLSLPLTTLECNIDGPTSVAFDLTWNLPVLVRPD